MPSRADPMHFTRKGQGTGGLHVNRLLLDEKNAFICYGIEAQTMASSYNYQNALTNSPKSPKNCDCNKCLFCMNRYRSQNKFFQIRNNSDFNSI